MRKKAAALFLSAVMLLQPGGSIFAGEVPEVTEDSFADEMVFDSDSIPSEDLQVFEDSDPDQTEAMETALEEDDFLAEDSVHDPSFEDENAGIVENGVSENEISDDRDALIEDESAEEMADEYSDSYLASDDDEYDDEYDDYDEEGNSYHYTVEAGDTLILSPEEGLTEGGSGFTWSKSVYNPGLDEDSWLVDSQVTGLAETTSTLQLQNIQETAVYTLSWTSPDEDLMEWRFYVTVDNGFATYSRDTGTTTFLKSGETHTFKIDVRANDLTGIRYKWFSSTDWEQFTEVTSNGNSCTIESPDRLTMYVCFVLDQYGNCEEHKFYVSVENLIITGPYETSVCVSQNQTYTMTPAVKTLDGTDDQLHYTWSSEDLNLDDFHERSFTPAQISDGDEYACNVKDHLGNNITFNWYFTVAGNELTLGYQEEYQCRYGSDVTLEVTAASGDTSTPIRYQWYKVVYDERTWEETYLLLDGQTQAKLYLEKPQEGAGYVCAVTQGSTTKRAFIYLNLIGDLKIDMPENANSAFVVVPDAQGNAQLTVNASSPHGAVSYKWRRGDTWEDLGSGTSSITVREPGYYCVNVTDGITFETVNYLVGNPVQGSTSQDAAQVLPANQPLLIRHPLNSIVYVKIADEGLLKFRSTSYCKVRVIKADGTTITDAEGFSDEYDMYYDPDVDGSPAYLRITTNYADGFDDPVTLVWYSSDDGGESAWSDWEEVSPATCTASAIIRRYRQDGSGTYEEMFTGAPLGHSFGAGVTTVPPTALAEGKMESTCSRCGLRVPASLAKLPAHLTLNATGSVPLQVSKKASTIEAVSMAAGDYLLSAVSSNKTVIPNVSVSGNKVTIKAGKKTGASKITVTTAAGASATFTVKVQKGRVYAKKAVNFPKKLTLMKGQTYTLNSVITPITVPDKIKYSTDAKKVAAVSKKGVITAKNKGKAVISLKVGTKIFKCNVTVK